MIILLLILIIIFLKICYIFKLYSIDFIYKVLYDYFKNKKSIENFNFIKNPIHTKYIEYFPILPILTKKNREKYLEWHIYYENIYKKQVKKEIDLNKFTWFYWDKLPLKNIQIYNINNFYLFDFKLNKINNIAWTGIFGPERLCYKYGFFVKRRINNKLLNKNKLEVFRVDLNNSNYKNISVYKELNCIWYFHTIGSGIFIFNYKNKLILNDKIDWNFNSYYNEIDINAIKELKKNNIKIVIIKECHKIHNTIPRTEIIVIY